jgi:anti-sigma factor RsiW
MSFCPSKDIHSVYLDGELPENYKAEYELHISHCEKCRKELEQLKALRAMFKADSDSLKLDQHFMDESFQRLQIKMAYSKNVGKLPQKSPFKVISYVASGVAAAALLALVLPVGFKASAGQSEMQAGSAVASTVISSPLIGAVASGMGASSVPITSVSTSGKTAAANNVAFDSGRSVVVSGNIQDVVLSSENKRKTGSSFTKNVSDVDVLRPDFQDEAINIKITVPGMGDFPVTTEINLPMELVSGRR